MAGKSAIARLAESCEVMVIGCQPERISAPDIEMGLTKSVEEAIPKAIKLILEEIGLIKCQY